MQSEASGESPFHAGERIVQERLGVREGIEPWARKVVRPYLPEEHSDFYAALPFLVAAARDERGRPWATVLAGAPGFVSSPDSKTLRIEGEPVAGDALNGNLGPGADVGLLGIELATRRRNRVNGRVRERGAGVLALSVDQSFGNCPQYITEREWRHVPDEGGPCPRSQLDRLTPELAGRIQAADTFFIATGHRDEGESDTFGMDASHRGGAPGFVEVVDDRTLVFPDYAGNNHYNTIGNLIMDPRAGLLFVDFETGDMLQLSGKAQIDWDSDDLSRFPGAQRLVYFEIEQGISLGSALSLRWAPPDDAGQDLRLIEKIRESADVVSFVFEAGDGQPLAAFTAGQHLPLEIELPGHRAPLARTYSLSNSPNDARYRISVKRESHGTASRHLHDSVEIGAIVSARAPAGHFVLDHGQRPVVLVSAGIGSTPMLSMLHALTESPEDRPVWFVHGAKDGEHHPFADEVRALELADTSVNTHVSFSRPLPADREGRDYHTEGRVTGTLLKSLLPGLDAEFYLCGPVAFMASLQAELEALGVSEIQIHSESFGG